MMLCTNSRYKRFLEKLKYILQIKLNTRVRSTCMMGVNPYAVWVAKIYTQLHKLYYLESFVQIVVQIIWSSPCF